MPHAGDIDVKIKCDFCSHSERVSFCFCFGGQGDVIYKITAFVTRPCS